MIVVQGTTHSPVEHKEKVKDRKFSLANKYCPFNINIYLLCIKVETPEKTKEQSIELHSVTGAMQTTENLDSVSVSKPSQTFQNIIKSSLVKFIEQIEESRQEEEKQEK